jgi:hypothetical protein
MKTNLQDLSTIINNLVDHSRYHLTGRLQTTPVELFGIRMNADILENGGDEFLVLTDSTLGRNILLNIKEGDVDTYHPAYDTLHQTIYELFTELLRNTEDKKDLDRLEKKFNKFVHWSGVYKATAGTMAIAS